MATDGLQALVAINAGGRIRLTGGEVVTGFGVRSCDVILGESEFVELAKPDADIPGVPRVDVAGSYVTAGFIETQINGGFGHDFTNDPVSIWSVGRELAAHGVTAFLPTLVSATSDRIATAQQVLMEGPPPLYVGAMPIGLHVEGPFLAPERRGTHPVNRLAFPGEVDTSSWSRDAGIVLVTLAPELPGALDLAGNLMERGVVLAAGHTAATYETAVLAAARGIRHATHLFNGMGPVTPREPGLAGHFLTQPGVSASFIADGVHSHPAMSRLLWQCLGGENLVLISDGIAGMGLPSGKYGLAGMTIESDGAKATGPGGTLAGSVVTIDRMLRRFTMHSGVGFAETLSTVTSAPARLLGDDSRGSLEQGKRGDVVVMADDGEVQLTFISGRLAYVSRDFGEQTSGGG